MLEVVVSGCLFRKLAPETFIPLRYLIAVHGYYVVELSLEVFVFQLVLIYLPLLFLQCPTGLFYLVVVFPLQIIELLLQFLYLKYLNIGIRGLPNHSRLFTQFLIVSYD